MPDSMLILIDFLVLYLWPLEVEFRLDLFVCFLDSFFGQLLCFPLLNVVRTPECLYLYYETHILFEKRRKLSPFSHWMGLSFD